MAKNRPLAPSRPRNRPKPLSTDVIHYQLKGEAPRVAVLRTWRVALKRCPLHAQCHTWRQESVADIVGLEGIVGPVNRCQVNINPDEVHDELFGDGSVDRSVVRAPYQQGPRPAPGHFAVDAE